MTSRRCYYCHKGINENLNSTDKKVIDAYRARVQAEPNSFDVCSACIPIVREATEFSTIKEG